MRIAVVHPYPWPEVRRGAERYLDDLSHYLAYNGHEVEIVTGTHGEGSVEERSDGAVIRRLTHLRPGPASRAGLSEVETFGIRAVGRLRRSRPDVVHAFTPSGSLAGRIARRPTLYTVLGHPHREQLPAQASLRGLFAIAVRSASVTAVLSEASAIALLDTLGCRAAVLPPGVRLERFAPNLKARDGPPRILFSATLADRRKRADLAVATLALLLERHPDARLGLSGEGDPSWVLDLARRGGDHVRAAIDVLGPGEPGEVPARYRSATLTLLPAEHEAFGLALVESLASGTPVVCAPTGGMPEIVSDDVGVVAGASDPLSFAGAVERALSLGADPATPARCVARASMWSWKDVVGPAHERIYRTMATGTDGAMRTDGTTGTDGEAGAMDSTNGHVWGIRPA